MPQLNEGRRTHRFIGAAALALGAAWFGAGCVDKVPVVRDSGMRPGDDPDADAGVLDSDADGVCDDTELASASDPFDPDTDDDGLEDRAELANGYYPNRTDSPRRESLVLLEETAESAIDLSIAMVVNARGESYFGAFEALPVSDPDGLDASAFYARAVALGAVPMDNVTEMIEAEERFNTVLGRTELDFRVSFEFGANTQRGCVRGFPFRYNVRDGDGDSAGSQRFLLVVVPEGQALESTRWCQPERSCF